MNKKHFVIYFDENKKEAVTKNIKRMGNGTS